ncbi:MAG: hypothetical protein LBU67_03890, partial [Oscillospiraceae bacterium]|nr:hypothetical protein [Oscillospiraceae bacterium]
MGISIPFFPCVCKGAKTLEWTIERLKEIDKTKRDFAFVMGSAPAGFRLTELIVSINEHRH